MVTLDIRKKRDLWKKKDINRNRAYSRKCSNKSVLEMKDKYIKDLLKSSGLIYAPQEIIDIKRHVLKLKRLIREKTKCKQKT